jgi:hypothetical protein
MEEVGFSPCDACQNKIANLRCSNCKCNYYCDKSCQKAHWKIHKKECIRLTKKKLAFNVADNESHTLENRNQDNASSGECCICFEQIDVNQLQLPCIGVNKTLFTPYSCNHNFCVECMLKVKMEFKKTFCPLCILTDTGGWINEYLKTNIVMFLQRAKSSPFKRAHYCHLARI